jgi:hypothetical protein
MSPLLTLFLTVALAGCAQAVVTTVAPPIPPVVETCPPAAPDPPALPPIRSVERLALFAQQANAARVHDKAALRECVMRLHQAVETLNAARINQGSLP